MPLTCSPSVACSRASQLGFALALVLLLACGGHTADEVVQGTDGTVDSAVVPAVEADASLPVEPAEPPEPPGPPPTDEPEAPAPRGALKHALYVVAHQDDDLTLMNPDMLHDLATGASVRTVYLTSGDAGFTCAAYTAGRERGIQVGYATLLGVPDEWDAHEVEVAGKLVRITTLRGTRLTLAFIGLHNSGIFDTALPDLENLWSGAAAAIETRPYDGRSRIDRYTRDELIGTLAKLMEDFQATHVNTLDSSRLQPLVWPFDHSDHVHSALFALAAAQRYRVPAQIGMYRAYNFAFEQENVAPAVAELKLAAFQAYMDHDAKICRTGSTIICGVPTTCDDPSVYDGYEKRQYRVVVYQNVSGMLRGPQGTCLRADFTSGRPLLGPCDPADPMQHWRVGTNSSIRHLYTSHCVTAEKLSQGSALKLSRCRGELTQRFVLTAHSQLRGPDATCVQGDDGSLKLAECKFDNRQLDWNPQPYRDVLTAIIEGLSDTPNALPYYGTLAFADLDGNGTSDFCARQADGIYCAYWQTKGFVDFALRLPAFRDVDGWSLPAYGSTVQLGDIDGDRRADVCGRGREGVFCATYAPDQRAFVNFSLRTKGADFSDAAGYASARSRYRSLRLVDVNGDGFADVCARAAAGIECALNTRDGHFAAATTWSRAGDFSDERGWLEDSWGETLDFADLNGDQRADVCGRTANGIHCARNDGNGQFVDGHLWSVTGDFADDRGWARSLAYYGTIQLADVDADGRADVCGRSSNGLVCGLSTGTGFSSVRPLMAGAAFKDAEGWGVEQYGSTLSFLNLDSDGLPDLCAWGPDPRGTIGLRCSLAR